MQRREQKCDQAAQREVSCSKAELSGQGRQSLRTLTFGSLDAKAVADALRKLDVAGMPVTRSPSRLLAAVTMVRESDDEVLANLDKT